MELVRRRIRADLVRQVGRHDQPEVFDGPPGDPGLVGGPNSMSWRLHADVASVVIGGIGAIIMEMLHPSVLAGVQDHSDYAADPYRRARTTFGYVVTTTFGNTEAAEGLVDQVRHIHGYVHGTRPDGVAYRALDPELIAWVHTCIPWGVMRAYERFNQPLTEDEKDQYLAEQSVIGLRGGAEEVPTTAADLDDYVEQMRPRLAVNTQTREFHDFLLSSPFGVRLPAGPLTRQFNHAQLAAGMSLMPDWAGRLTGFHHSTVVQRLVDDPSLQAYASTVRWAWGTPPYARMAARRAAATEAAAEPALAAAT